MKVDPVEDESSRTGSRVRGATFAGQIVSPLTLHDNENGDPNARVKQIKKEVLSIDVIDVA
ncbi:MAG: hypothetical protein WBC78_06390, partial [Candidatus Sulfotelmatobacter sp.]